MIQALVGGAQFLLFLLQPARLFERLYGLPWYRNMLHDWVQAMLDEPALNIVELGCATGELSAWLAGRGHPVTAVDQSATRIQQAKSRYPAVTWLHTQAVAVPLPSGGADRVLAASLLNVVPDPIVLLREMARLAGAAGEISVLVPAAPFPFRAARAVARGLPQGVQRVAFWAWHCLAKKMSAAEVSLAFAQAGLGPPIFRQALGGMVLMASVRGTPCKQ